MIRPVQHPKPDLSRFQTRQIVVPPNRNQLEAKLQEWMNEVVNNTRQRRAIHGLPAARYLVLHAEGIDSIADGPAGMRLGAGGAVQTVYARFYFAGAPNGAWFVEHVKFSPRQTEVQQKITADREAEEKQELRKRILARVEAEHRVHPKTLSFHAELHLETWQEDISKGKEIIQREIEEVYGYAKKAAKIPDNPYGPKDMAMAALGSTVSTLGKTGERAEKLAKAYEKTEKFLNGVEEGEKLAKLRESKPKGDVFEESQKRVYEESKGDVIAEKVIDLASEIPGAGKFVKGFAGMFFDFAAANYAGLVTKIRGRAYSWYIAGYIQGLTGVALERPPKDELDAFFFNLGSAHARRMAEIGRFRAQVFLLWYSSTHYVNNSSAGEKIVHPDEWTFPDGYLAHWSPERLGGAFTALLKRKEYLVD